LSVRVKASLIAVLAAAGLAGLLTAQSATVSGEVVLVRKDGKTADPVGAVVWLESLDGKPRLKPGNFTMTQKDKRFDPHVLVVPLGSTVAFPNLDPFFHNVFSLFDGRRFDLGLYEAGASRTVTFPRPGVCYIFCNIHPEMSAVVVAVDTPYFAVAGPKGNFSIDAVPAGRYRLTVWHQRGKASNPSEIPVEIQVPATGLRLNTIHLAESGSLLMPHKNKYGKDYDVSTSASPIYH
jgi:plastocyanin